MYQHDTMGAHAGYASRPMAATFGAAGAQFPLAPGFGYGIMGQAPAEKTFSEKFTEWRHAKSLGVENQVLAGVGLAAAGVWAAYYFGVFGKRRK